MPHPYRRRNPAHPHPAAVLAPTDLTVAGVLAALLVIGVTLIIQGLI